MKILGQQIEWTDPKLCDLALTHRSVRACGKNNERLEFLGDSVLSLVISKYLYQTYDDLSEGDLTRLRSQLVNGKKLAEVGRHYGLGNVIKLGPGEIKSGGVNKSSVIADAVEAVFGAVILDKGHRFAEQFVTAIMQPWLRQIDPEKIQKDSKSLLQEYVQETGEERPQYQTVKEQEVNGAIQFTVKCLLPKYKLETQAVANSRKIAEQMTAEQMLNLLNE